MWAYLGLYPLAGTPTYILSAPVWASATLAVPAVYDTRPLAAGAGGAAARPVLTITAHNASARNVFAFAAAANGAGLPQPLVDHAQLFTAGGVGTLEFWMTDAPTAWGLPPTRS